MCRQFGVILRLYLMIVTPNVTARYSGSR
jgi:hypothetical protein